MLLVDLCGATSAQVLHGSVKFAELQKSLANAMSAMEPRTGFRVLEEQGDGFILFRKAVDPNEKLASTGDLLVTHELRLRMHESPKSRNCTVEPLRFDKPLKGLELLGEATTLSYRIRLPRQRDVLDRLFPESYRRCRKELGEGCMKIPVFGRMFHPIPMEENFLELLLDPVSRRRAGKRDQFRDLQSLELRELRDQTGGYELGGTGDGGSLGESARVKASDLGKHYRHGIVLGLPGAGKWTILRHMVHQTLKREPAAPLLLASAGQMIAGHGKLSPPDSAKGSYTKFGALKLLLALFVWPGEAVAKADAGDLEVLTNHFLSAWDNHEATVLIDALDEAVTPEHRHLIIQAIRVLYESLKWSRTIYPEEARSSRLFCTVRRRYRDEFDLEKYVLLEVETLDQGDLQKLARAVFDRQGKRPLADRFTREIPWQPAAVRLGGTPMTALLLLFYFERRKEWGSRYAIYDALIRFVLLRVLGQCKTGCKCQPGGTRSVF
jgi:hypothetical protein